MIAKDHKEVIIKPATLTDAPRIAELGAHVFSITFGHSVEPHELDAFLEESYTETSIVNDLNDPNKDVIMATNSDDGVLGFAYLTRGSSEPCVENMEKTVELQRIYVHPDSDGAGVGKALEKAIESMAKEQGFKSLWLGVWEENPRAIRAYEKWGYKRVGEHDFTIGSVVQTDYIMVKSL
ncbi:gnat family protein acetyltransferase [Fusarium coicis]|nr:gnat family protein acetyltransferase [Fusarium coicis]